MRFERLRRVADTSMLVSTATALLRPSGRSPVRYPSNDDAAIGSLFHSSRLMTGIDRALVSGGQIWERAKRESSILSIVDATLPERISFTGVALMAATVTNVVLAVGFGAPLGVLAWLLRAGCVAFGALCSRYPERVAAAWESWRGHA